MEVYPYCYSGGKKLRCGYTTGSCAAAAAKAAVTHLLTGKEQAAVSILLPKGIQLCLSSELCSVSPGKAVYGVRKDAGDDADVTNRLLICAEVSFFPGREILVEGGEGVGRVTRPGLEQPPGAAAINQIPRRMIEQEVREGLDRFGANLGARVTVSVPDGQRAAAKTYNPRLGIVGGISILGTTGIVEPMSEAALIQTIRAELDMLRAAGDTPILLTPGNYGERFASKEIGLPLDRAALCSNFIGDALDYADHLGFTGLLLVGHIGKLVKLAAGVFQTHSRVADARMEIFAAHAALAGADRMLASALMQADTTDRAVELLEQAGLRDPVMKTIIEKIGFHLGQRLKNTPFGAVVFSNQYGILGQTLGAEQLIFQIKRACWRKEDAGKIVRGECRTRGPGADDPESGAGDPLL